MAFLTIHLSEAALARLQQRAAALGTTAEAVAAADLEPPPVPTMAPTEALDAILSRLGPVPAEFAAPPPLPPGDDPILRWAGIADSGVTDAGENHDHYIGQYLAERKLGHRPGPADVR